MGRSPAAAVVCLLTQTHKTPIFTVTHYHRRMGMVKRGLKVPVSQRALVARITESWRRRQP